MYEVENCLSIMFIETYVRVSAFSLASFNNLYCKDGMENLRKMLCICITFTDYMSKIM